MKKFLIPAGLVILTACQTVAVSDQGAGTIALSMPVACSIGDDCMVNRYVDHDTSEGFRDHMCGRRTTNGRRGTSFAITDTARFWDGVAVTAAADGRVVGVRDGERDGQFILFGLESIRKKECGNGVMLDHGDRWRTKYCHMRNGSVLVSKGQFVTRGERIGTVGVSGYSNYAFLDFVVQRHGSNVDPFDLHSEGSCSGPKTAIWEEAVLPMLRCGVRGKAIWCMKALTPGGPQIPGVASRLSWWRQRTEIRSAGRRSRFGNHPPQLTRNLAGLVEG